MLRAGYAVAQGVVMAGEDSIFVGGGGEGYTAPQNLLLKYGNRHGLVAGATGTGKTVTLQVLAEGFSAAGVPVFMADVKGDLSGMAVAGNAAAAPPSAIRWNTGPFRSCSGICSARKATRFAPPWPRWAPCC
jgi:hypothetical protein